MASAQSLIWQLPPGTHNLAVGTNLRGSMVGSSSLRRQAASEGSQPSTEYISMRYNFKPPAVANARGVIQQAASNNEYHMQLTSESGEQHSFTAITSQPKKDVECVIFYDPVTKLLVLERLDHLLTVTHQRGSSAATPLSTPLSTFTAHPQSSTEKQQPAPASITQHQQQLQQRPLATRTAPPIPSSRSLPTPPSTSPPDFASLPAVRNTALPKKPVRAAAASEEPPATATAPVTQPSSVVSGHGRRSSTSAHSVPSLAHIALPPLPASNSTHGSTSTPQSLPASLSEFALQQRALEAQATDGHSNVSNSGFTSDPEDMYDLGQPTSVNALQLSTSSTSPRKRPRDDEEESDPDEEELHFGKRTRQIKRVKTSQSPASGSDATPLAAPNTGYRSTPGVTNSSYTSPFGARPEAPSLIHGHSPLAQSFSPNDESQEPPPPLTQMHYAPDDDDDEDEEEENSDSDSDSTDSDDEVLHPPIQPDTYVYTVPDPNPIVYRNEEEDDSDEDDEDDFLMQALGESGQGVGGGTGTAAASEYYSGDGDSSDNSDYGEH